MTNRSKRTGRRRLARLVPLPLLISTVATTEASAYEYLGCQYGGSAVRQFPIRYETSLTTAWSTNLNVARGWWNSAASEDINVTQASPTGSYVFSARTINDPTKPSAAFSYGCSGGQPVSAHIYFNLANISNNVDDWNKVVATHELGHAMGLWHTATNPSCSDQVMLPGQTYPNGTVPRSVMSGSGSNWARQNCSGVLPPYADDVGGIRANYPGGK
jgi:Dual-action HEIGH metallo-peptidase